VALLGLRNFCFSIKADAIDDKKTTPLAKSNNNTGRTKTKYLGADWMLTGRGFMATKIKNGTRV
jgi:hypothetical protein